MDGVVDEALEVDAHVPDHLRTSIIKALTTARARAPSGLRWSKFNGGARRRCARGAGAMERDCSTAARWRLLADGVVARPRQRKLRI
ncbi:hypothetical protein [Cryobacterium sp. Y11]|uniref:hypothetical protein n=1 Tax=Cryobacterium sp. Y11 TaxID=2045016 RepID=UPI000CE387FF|nr:hypothetical protein [Cryobacterium sp. Y11]